jgi:hypothetical protein
MSSLLSKASTALKNLKGYLNGGNKPVMILEKRTANSPNNFSNMKSQNKKLTVSRVLPPVHVYATEKPPMFPWGIVETNKDPLIINHYMDKSESKAMECAKANLEDLGVVSMLEPEVTFLSNFQIELTFIPLQMEEVEQPSPGESIEMVEPKKVIDIVPSVDVRKV